MRSSTTSSSADEPGGRRARLPATLGSRRFLLFGVPAVVGALVLAGAAWFAPVHRPRTRAEAVRLVRANLEQQRETRRSALASWISETFQDAAVVAGYPTTQELLRAAQRGPVRPNPHLGQILATSAETEEIDCIHVLDAALRQVAGSHLDMDPALMPLARRVLESAQREVDVVVRRDRIPRVVFAVPAHVDGSTRPAGVVAVVVNPGVWLYPFLATPPSSDATGEALLVRPDGDSMLFISPLRLGERAPLTFRMARSSGIAASYALAGRVGSGEYLDYRGRPVFAAFTRVAGTSWGLVVKVDAVEALAPWRRHMTATAMTEGGLLLLAALLLVATWWGVRKAHQADAARDRAHVATLLDQASDPILFVELDGTIRSANRRAEEFYGYGPGALVGRSAFSLRAPHLRGEAEAQHRETTRLGGATFRTLHRTADGRDVPVEVSARRVNVADDEVFVSVVRDIRDRDDAEQRILRLNRMLRTLSEINQLMLRGQTDAQVMQEACAIAVEHGGFQLAWIGIGNPDGTVSIAASAGKAAYLDGVTVRWDDSPFGQGPTGTALREDRTVIIADMRTDPRFAPWRERADAHGLRSSAACPIRKDGRVAGALMLYADAPDYFDTESTALLEELAGDLGFALRSLEERAALHDMETKLRAFFQSNAVGMLFGDIHGRILDANDELLRIVGYTRAELAAGTLRWDAITPTEFLPLDAERIAEAQVRGVCTPYEKQYVRKSGERVWVLVGYSLIGEQRDRSVAFVVDISARKRAEEAEAAARRQRDAAIQRLSLQVERLPIALVLTDPDLTVLEWNPAAERIFGWSRAEVVGRNGIEMIVEEAARPGVREFLSGLSGSSETHRYVNLNVRKDGRTILCEWHNTPLLDDQGRLVGLLAMAQDVSEQQRAEDALRDSEQRFRLVVEGAPVGILVQVEGTIRYLNGTAARLFGVAADGTLFGTPVMDRVHPADREAVAARIATLLQRHAPVPPREERFLRVDGSEFWVEVEAVPLFHEAVAGAMVFFRDVTAHRRAMEEQALVSAALEQSAEVAVITDREGTIVYVNPAFERVTGYARSEVLGKNPRVLKSGQQDDAYYRRMWDTLVAGRVFSGTLTNRRKDGAVYVAEVAISPIRDATGRITRYLGLQRDITREHQLEEQLRQSQKMEAVGRLTGGVAHDFNNLLGVILANAAVLRRDLPAERGDLMDYVDDVIEAATGGGAMVRKLLAFSRRERLTPATVDLAQALADTARTLQRYLPETIAVSVHAPERLPALLDPTAFDQIMLNLATNARDAMPAGGTMAIHAGETELLGEEAVGAAQPGRYVCVEVTDTGHGMDAETLSHVFEPFFTTKPSGHGTGLGLAMVFGLMRQLGGFVHISSTPEQGTTVRLYFRSGPARATPLPATAPAAPREARQGAGRILVVEDQDRLRRATARALGRLGYEVVVAADAQEAMRVLADADPPVDLVLSDLVMPGISGAVLYQRLRAEGRTVPFLLMSGYASGSGEASSVPEGVALIMKPWSLEALDAQIRQMIGQPAS